MTNTDIEVRAGVEGDRLGQLMDLFSSAWWTTSRTVEDVAKMLAASSVVIALVHRPSDRLVGFARAVTDEVYLGVVLDVIVVPDWQGHGLGAMLLDAVVGHPRLAAVRSVELVCQPELVAFYQRWGFTENVGRSLLMRRSDDRWLVRST